jgi:hypothetical protein
MTRTILTRRHIRLAVMTAFACLALARFASAQVAEGSFERTLPSS